MDAEDGFLTLPTADDTIEFHAEDVAFTLQQATKIIAWVRQLIQSENQQLHHLNVIFCSDAYLHHINMTYLNHDTFTDIITFPYADPPVVEGDIFISIDRVRENAEQYQVSFQTELHRVISHGVWHLCGYGDQTKAEKQKMRQKEDEALALLFNSKNE